ncbi:TonB-dependent receptor [Oxalobacteraceae bacterium GrIS 2.11]
MKSPRFAQTVIAFSIAQVFTLGFSQMAIADVPANQPAVAENSADSAGSAAGSTGTESAVEQIVIQAQRSSNALARAAQKEAPNLINLMTAEDMKKLPDVSVGEALRRIPGISLETDTGEGRYINIRGIDSDLNSTTFAGMRLPASNNASPQVGGRAVAMDAIPNGLVGALTVTKSNLPEQDAEAIGGTIEITPKTAPSNGRPFLEGHIGSGYEPLRGTPVTDLTVSGGGRFGSGNQTDSTVSAYRDRPFSVVATAAYYEDKRGVNDVEPAFIDGGAFPSPSQALGGWDQRWYQYHRQRHGLGLDLGYQADADNSYYIRGFDAGYTETVHRQRLTVTPDGNQGLSTDPVLPVNTVQSGGSFTDTLGISGFDKTLRDEKEKIDNSVFMIGGKNRFGSNVLDYRIGYTRGSFKKLYDYNSDFNFTPSSNATVTYNFNGTGHTPLFTVANANYLDPSNYSLAGFKNSTETINDDEKSAAINFKFATNWLGGDDESMKVGASLRNRSRTLDNPQYSLPKALFGLPLTSAISGNDISFYHGQYLNLPQINTGQLQGQYGADMVTSGKDAANTLRSQARDKEDVDAMYGQYEWERGDLSVLGGVRVERTAGTYDGITVNVDSHGALVSSAPADGSKTYNNVFPSLQARLKQDADTQIRAAYSTAIARPGFPQLNPSLLIDTGANAVTLGNPDLKPITSNAFDLSYEHYLPDAGIISFGLFDKELKNYIIANQTSLIYPNNGLFAGLVGAVHVQTYSNADKSHVRGLEFNYEQRFKNLPGVWGGLGAGVNYTYANSSFQIRPGESALLPSTSKNTGNITVFYERDGINVRLGGYYVSHDLWAVGGSKDTDVYNDGRFTMDLGSSYAINSNWGVYANLKNLTNTPLTFYEGYSNRVIQREYYGVTVQAGVNFSF